MLSETFLVVNEEKILKIALWREITRRNDTKRAQLIRSGIHDHILARRMVSRLDFFKNFAILIRKSSLFAHFYEMHNCIIRLHNYEIAA